MAQDEKVFPKGMIYKAPREKAPDYVKGSLSFKVDEFKIFLDENSKNGWVNVNLKEAKSGKYYAELDTWVPSNNKKDASEKEVSESEEIGADDIPF